MNRVVIALGALFTGVLPVLINSAMKGAGLLLVAAISALILRKASAAIRHLVWLCALGGLLILPILSALLPGWDVLPRPNTAVPKSAPSFKPEEPFQPHSEQGMIVELEPVPARAASVLPIASKSSLPAYNWLPLVWMAGFALLAMRVIAAQWFLSLAGKRGIVVRNGRLAEAMQDARQQLNVGQPVQLLLDLRRTIPMAWGVMRPRVLLPAEAADWDETRLRAVLLHEMAHIKRGDAAVRWLAQLSCALHWFNPLVWFAASRLRVESERACDDLVLTNGVRSSDYAKHLLHVATTLAPARMTQACGLTMALPSALEGRLLAVLNQRVNRGRVTRVCALAALTVGLCFVVPVAMLRAASNEAKSTNEIQTVTAVAAETAKPTPIESASAGDNEVNRVKLIHAESQLQRATQLRAQNLISEGELNKARTEMEIARAELAGRPDAVAGIKLRDAETELARVEELHKSSLVSQQEVDQAKYQVALLRAEMRGDAAEAARVRLTQAEDELKRATQLRLQNVISETDFNDARQRVELLRAELRQSAIARPATTSSADETETLLKAIDEARAKALAVELKAREAGRDPGWSIFNEARVERDKQLATARNQPERLTVYERYAQEAADRERQFVEKIETGSQPLGIGAIARYETLLAQFELAQAKGRTLGPARQILVEARVIEAPATERIPDDPSKIKSGKGINVLGSPRVVTGIGEEAEIFIGQELPANATPGAMEYLRTGITMRVTPRLKEDRIAYTVRLTLSDLVHSEAKDTQFINETASRELHVSGTAKDGEGTWFHLNEHRNDKKVSVISVWLRFKRQD